MVINVYCQHQLKETGKETTDLSERLKVFTFRQKHPVGFGVGKQDFFFSFFFFFGAHKTLSQLSLIRLAASSCHQRDQRED